MLVFQKDSAFTQHLLDSIGRSASWVQDAETAKAKEKTRKA